MSVWVIACRVFELAGGTLPIGGTKAPTTSAMAAKGNNQG